MASFVGSDPVADCRNKLGLWFDGDLVGFLLILLLFNGGFLGAVDVRFWLDFSLYGSRCCEGLVWL